MVTEGASALRIVFFGTPDFAVPTLEALLASRHDVVGVVTQPDRPKGRGQRSHQSPVKDVSLLHDLPVLQPEKLKDESFMLAFTSLQPDLAVVAAYGRILSDTLLSIPPLGFLNVHASLLPKYRGAAPIHRAVMAGETETGVTIMRVVRALDAGPMLATATRSIGPDDSSVEIERDLAALGAPLLISVVDRLVEGTVIETPQDESAATYAPRLEKLEGQIDWTDAARVIHNKVRGLQPWPHAFTYFKGERIIVLRSEIAEPPNNEAWGARPGRTIEAAGDSLTVATGEGIVRLLSLQMESGRPLTAREFIAGQRVSPGSLFGQTV